MCKIFSVMVTLLHIFLLIFILGVKCDLEQLFQTCCTLGKNKITDSLKCEKKIRTPIPGVLVEHQGICLATIDLCCVQFLREIACEKGKQAAKQQKNCNIQPKSDDEVNYKYCCESCKLGMISSSMSMDCKLTNFHFNNPWDGAYESCCYEFAPQEIPSAVNATQKHVNICDFLPGELCSHICIPEKSSYHCECRPGSVLMADGKSCKPEPPERSCEKFNICDQNCFYNGDTIECYCNPGYELLADNRTCVDINECNLKIDVCYTQNKICLNTQGGYECNEDPNGKQVTRNKPDNVVIGSCAEGHIRDPNSNQCVDIDECRETNPCRNGEICINHVGGFRCFQNVFPITTPSYTSTTKFCNVGYIYNSQIKQCIDINECEENPCEINEVCENLSGNFRCRCKVGFQKDLTGACVDINECQLNGKICTEAERCDNTVGSYRCFRTSGCGTGYTFNEETKTCEDDNECVLGTDNCKMLGFDFECRNTLGSFRCEKKSPCDKIGLNCTKLVNSGCSKGFEYIKGACVDINECKNKSTCLANQSCINTPGSYRCVSELICGPGMKLSNDQQYCVDIDECAEQQKPCDHNCINVWGSFRCSCSPGYRLHDDNRSCIDMNECELFKNRRLCHGNCINTPGSYKCQCPDGYKLSSNGVFCEDINECAQNVCSKPNDICVNIGGSYRCNALTCPVNYIPDPSRKNRCMRIGNFCILNPKDCSQTPLFYSFSYIAYPSNFVLPSSGQQSVFYLKGMNSPNTTTDFSWELINVLSPLGIEKVTRNYFRLNLESASEVMLYLVKSIQGPQEIEMELKTNFRINGVFSGFSINKLFLYISQHDF